jgi:hypothetical protein
MRAVPMSVVLFSLAACGTGAKVSRDDLAQSKAEYQICLAGNVQTPNKCEALHQAYEADLQAYKPGD